MTQKQKSKASSALGKLFGAKAGLGGKAGPGTAFGAAKWGKLSKNVDIAAQA